MNGKIHHRYVGVFLVLVGLSVGPVDAKTLYVNGATGNDSVTYAANSESQPWRTIGRAVWGSPSYSTPNASQAAQPGDLVLISAGLYWEGNGGDTSASGSRFRVILNPANSGTQTQPITIRGVGTVEIRIINGVRGPMIGCANRNYVIWDHFVIDDTYGGSREDTGPVVFHITTGCQLINSEVRGHNGAYHWGYPTYGGNYRLVSLEPAESVLIRNNSISRAKLGTGPGGQNEACVMAYDANDNIIEHNDFADCGAAVFIKGTHPGQTLDRNLIRYNRITTCHHVGLRILEGANNRVYQNIIQGCDTGGAIRIGWGPAINTLVVNNTIVGNPNGIYLQGLDMSNTQVYNNIVVGPGPAIFGSSGATPGTQNFVANRNLYHNVSPFADYDGTTYPWSQWRSTFGKDPNSLHGVNPLFVNAEARDYHLQSGSPALTLGRAIGGIGGPDGTVIPAGAYITGNEVIGRLSDNQNSQQSTPSGDLIAPDPVQNLRVIP